MSDTDQNYGLDDFGEADLQSFDAAASSPIKGTIRVGSTEYAIDIQWNIPSDPSAAVAEARHYAAGESDRPDFYCIKTSGKTQYGLGYASLGHKPNLPALAPHICSSKGPSFAGLFEVEGGYYLLGVHDDLILSDAELFIANENDAAEALTNLLGMNDFPEVYAPDSMEIEGSKNQTLESILVGRPPVRLKDINKSSSYIKIAFAAALVAIVIFGVRYYLDDVEMQRITDELARQAEVAQTRVGLKEEEIPIPPMPWEGKLQAAKALETCHREILKFPLDIPGWDISDLKCSPGGSGVSVVAYMSRSKSLEIGGAPISYAAQMVEDNGLKPVLSVPPSRGTTQNIAFTWSVSGIPIIPVDVSTESISEISNSLLKIMESRRTSFILSPADSNQYWDGITLEFRTNLSPIGYADILEAIPGFVLTSVEYKLADNNYTIKGKAYEQLPLPVKNAGQ